MENTLFLFMVKTVAYAGKSFEGFKVGGSGLLGGPGGDASRTPENIRKFAKDSRRKFQKCCIFAYFEKISKPSVKFSHVWTKNTIDGEILGKFWKFLMKNQLKIEFLSISGKTIPKTRNFGNNIIFQQQFFSGFRGFEPPKPPCVRQWVKMIWVFFDRPRNTRKS